jgi:hypothetical protein
MNDPPIMRRTRAGSTVGLYGRAPSVKYPSVRRVNADMIEKRNPARSANAPVKGGRKYIPAEKKPLIHAAQMSSNPTTRVKYNVIAMNTA